MIRTLRRPVAAAATVVLTADRGADEPERRAGAVQMSDADEDRVLVPEVTPPDGSDVVIGNDWLTSGGRVPTAAGPVVVVEAQEDLR